MPDYSRRTFLKTGSAVALVYSHGAVMSAQAVSQSEAVDQPSGRWLPFPLSAVRLGPGVFKEQAEVNARYLESLSTDRLLHSFRMTAGISSSSMPYGGWEEPTCELRGHFAGGHILSAVALASATDSNSVLSKRGDELVTVLAQCQKKIGTGYLSAFPPELFERLARGQKVWAPF